MLTKNLFETKAENELLNAQNIDNLELLKESGRPRGGIRLVKGQTITFPPVDTKYINFVTTPTGTPVYYVKAVINEERVVWLALGTIRKKPRELNDLKPYLVNYKFATMDNDFELLHELAEKTIKVVDEINFLIPRFSKNQPVFVEKTLDNGKIVSEQVFIERPFPIFEIVE